MDFKIKKIILWPKKETEQKREIPFEFDKINVIVGDSQTGKSSIIPIVDYCMGSNKCSIPVGPIRDYTSWFGILVVHGNTEIFIARKEPGSNKSTNEMYFEEGSNIIIPGSIVEGNRNNKQVVNRLNQLCKLPNIDFAEDVAEKKPQEERPSIKDFLAFCFQPQHIIANPYTLFYKADTIEHRFKLQTIFPLALGIIKNETLELERRLKLLKDELKYKLGILEDKKKIKEAWHSEVKTNYITALELGILNDTPFPEDSWKLEDYVVYLQQVPERVQRGKILKVDIGSSTKVVNYLNRLERNEQNIIDDLEEKKYKLSLIQNFNQVSLNYNVSVQNQRGRLELINNGWLSQKLHALNNCPLCGSENDSAKEDINTLISVSEELNEKVSKINSSKDILSKEVTELEKEIIDLEKKLNSVRVEIEGLGREHRKIEENKKRVEHIYRYVGRIEQNLKNLTEIDIDSKLYEEIINLEIGIDKINIQLGRLSANSRKEDVLKRISQSINTYKEILKVENASNPTNLDIKELTLKISSQRTGNEDHLWEIGSGSNWMGYHLATLLALHEFFLTLKTNNHTPSFIVFDQPSQAYFPENLEEKSKLQNRSDDLERVEAIFKAMSIFLVRNKFSSQIIVLEHADKEIWGNVPNINYVGGKRWKKDNALIPESWFF